MAEHPAVGRARRMDRERYPDGLRTDWHYYVRVHGHVVFTGSSEACRVACDAWVTEPSLTIRSRCGELALSNGNHSKRRRS